MMKNLKILLFLVVPVISSCKEKAVKEDHIFLELNLAEGEQYSLTMEMEQDLQADAGAEQVFVEQYFRFDIESTIETSDEARIYQLSNKYRRIVMQQRIEYEETEVINYLDTDDPSTAEISDKKLLTYYLNLLEWPYQSRMDRQGNILSSDINEINEKAGGKEFSSPYQSLFTYGIIYPGYALDLLDKWDKEINFRDSSVSVTGLMNYQLEAFDDERALISISGRIKAVQKGMQAAGKMELEQEGKIWIWIKSGWIKEADIQQKIKYIDAANPSEPRIIEGNVKIRGKQE
jgi:hypothetical protein